MVSPVSAPSQATPEPAQTPPLRLPRLPDHVAIIMDGNGRWARARGKARLAGHRAGTENIRRVIERFADYGVSYLTLYAFSTENWERPRYEVRGLMALLSRFLKREVKNLHAEGIRLLHIGDLAPLSGGLQRQVREAIELTKDNRRMTLVIAFNYGGRAEIVEAVKRIAVDGVPAEQVDEALIERYLSTSGVPDPDLIIRTAGELRISNFLLWQAAYAEFCFTDVYWPDFDIQHIDEALAAYSQRRRRFGGLLPDETDTPMNGTTPLNGGSPNGNGYRP
jgi:undecaprenyl diphosphate synthase